MLYEEPYMQWLAGLILILHGFVLGKIVYQKNLPKRQRLSIGLIPVSMILLFAPGLVPSLASGTRWLFLAAGLVVLAAAFVLRMLSAGKSDAKI